MLVESLYGAPRGLKSISGSFDSLSKNTLGKNQGFFASTHPGVLRPAKTPWRGCLAVPTGRNSQKRASGVKHAMHQGAAILSGPMRPPHDRAEFFSLCPNPWRPSWRGCCVAASGTRRRGAPTARGAGSGLRSSRRRAVYTPLKGGYTPATGFCEPGTRITPW